MDSQQTYTEYQEELEQEQKDLTRGEVKQLMRERNEHVFDPDDLPAPSAHNWVDRGVVLSCEGGAHPPHRAFKRIKR